MMLLAIFIVPHPALLLTELNNLKEQNNELTDACKTKDAALKRALQKLEYTTQDLDKLQEKTDETDGKL